MTMPTEIRIDLCEGKRVEALVRHHIVATDQPFDQGGGDSAPSPFELFLAAIGACAGYYVQSFCRARGLPTEGICILERPVAGPDGVLAHVGLEIVLPGGFPERYRNAVVRAAEQCTVKRAIQAEPTIGVSVATEAVLAPQG